MSLTSDENTIQRPFRNKSLDKDNSDPSPAGTVLCSLASEHLLLEASRHWMGPRIDIASDDRIRFGENDRPPMNEKGPLTFRFSTLLRKM